jgi:hypothetical protein
MQRRLHVFGIAALLVCACGPLGCEPVGPFPGGELGGEVASEPSDWSFTDDFKNIQLETDPDDPYSVTVWCVTHDGRLYIAAARGTESAWARNLLDDPRSRVRVDGKLYDQRAVQVTEREELDKVLDMFVAKYDFDLPSEEERAGGVLFRMESP